MKRSLNILMALMLSLMVVYLSVGTTVMHCLHYDKVMVGMVADGCVKRSMHTWISMQHQCLQASRQPFGRRCLVLLSVAFRRQDIGI